MTLKCSVFGHRFGDTEIAREREERGSEVVITITETETCERCGETRFISENTEVTTLETPSETAGDATDEADATGTEQDSGDAGSHDDSPAPLAGASAGAETGDGGAGVPDSPDEDDAVILDDAPDTGDGDDSQQRAPGEWPGDEDAVEEGWTPDTAGVAETGSEGLPPVESEQPEVERTGEAVTVPEGEFHCPACGFTTAVESSSLREGDFCPECHRSALEHHSEE